MADQMLYAEMLKKIKSSDHMKEIDESISKFTKTKDGSLRMVLSRGTLETEHLKSAITSTIGNKVNCTRLSDTSTIEIRDADEEATDDEIIKAIEKHTKSKGNIKIVNKRKMERGTQIITASIPTSIANTIINTQLRIGFVNCRTKLKIEVKKCYRCQGYGHTRKDCKNEERSNFCWKCGQDGHKNKECKNEARCLLCKEESTNDHILGSFKCHAYKRALEAAKTRK